LAVVETVFFAGGGVALGISESAMGALASFVLQLIQRFVYVSLLMGG